MKPIIVKNLHFEYEDRKSGGSLKVLDDISLQVEEGEFVSLIGPSGCGKSTLLNIVAGIVPYNHGTVRIGDQAIVPGHPVPPEEVGYVFQTPRLLNWLTVENNIKFVLSATDIPPGQWNRIIDSCLSMAGLHDFKKRYPLELSGGMQHRLALVRALAITPKIILMDEPMSGLDAITATKLRFELAGMMQKSRATVLHITHNISEAVFLADRIILMHERPSRIYKEIHVQLERPRDEADTALIELEHRVTKDFFANVMTGSNAAA